MKRPKSPLYWLADRQAGRSCPQKHRKSYFRYLHLAIPSFNSTQLKRGHIPVHARGPGAHPKIMGFSSRNRPKSSNFKINDGFEIARLCDFQKCPIFWVFYMYWIFSYKILGMEFTDPFSPCVRGQGEVNILKWMWHNVRKWVCKFLMLHFNGKKIIIYFLEIIKP